jgi:hypothetical protein
MILPGHHSHDDHRERHATKADRWLVGLVAGAALMFLLGKALGLGHASARAPGSSGNRASRD